MKPPLFPDYLRTVYYIEVLDCTMVAQYCTMVVLCIAVEVLQIVVHCYIMVVLETAAQYYTMDIVHFYTMISTQVFLLHVHPTPCMYLQSFLSSSPRFYSPCLHVQLTCKNYKMYSLVLSDTSALGGSDKYHAHVFLKSHIMVLLKLKGLAYPLQYTLQIMDTHSYDGLLSCTLYTRHLLFSPFLYHDSIGMSIYSNLVSSLP
jgi:hypothetical protein